MAFFQHSVLNKYINAQQEESVKQAYEKFSRYFHNPDIQQNIRDAKEEQFQEGFLRELFVEVFGYVLNPNPNYDLTSELKNEKGAKKADGAILSRGHDPLSTPKAIAVIELKGTDTTDLDKINGQAFNYKNNHSGCIYVITSNFEKLRFFIHNSVEHLEFNLFTLSEQDFRLMYLCLSAENLLNGLPLKVKEESLLRDETITKQLYKDYAAFKHDLWQNMVKNSHDGNQLVLFKKTQKLLDRFLFILFAEDSGLLPPNSVSRIVKRWTVLKEEDAYKPLYDIFKQYFGYINKGRKGQSPQDDIFAYNGGLFLDDLLLDAVVIDDAVLHHHVMKLTAYNFQSEVDVNILGHIFENSLNEIEDVTAMLEGQEADRSKSRRKKDGVFYTPKYITKYIVDNTLGKLCETKKQELGIVDEEYAKGRRNRKKDTIKQLDGLLTEYREWLLSLTICDPACGSGAFLNQALEFLIEEHAYADELKAQLFGGGLVFQDVSNHILENNIYGVDINDESVEIAKLSLWLRTAQRGRKLTTLNNNIKCGNSLIDDFAVAGEKAFDWKKEFPTVFRIKEKKAFHITTATHDSRTSQRMIDHKVRQLRDGGTRPKAEGIWLEPEDEILITNTLAEIIKEDQLNVMAYNICGDHMHLLLVCEEEEVSKIVGKIKAITSKEYNTAVGITTRGHVPLSKEEKKTYNSLWTQKFGCKEIEDEKQLWNTVEYIRTNREKHELPPLPQHSIGPLSHSNKGAGSLVLEQNELFYCSYDHAFRTEYKGGFDVVIGNPPYLRVQGLRGNFEKETQFYETEYKSATGRFDIYVLFIEKAFQLIKQLGKVSFILPHKFLISDFGEGIRSFLTNKQAVESLVHFGSEMVFEDASTYTCILGLSHGNEQLLYKQLNPSNVLFDFHFDKIDVKTLSGDKWNLQSGDSGEIFKKLSRHPFTLKDVLSAIRTGIDSGDDDLFIMQGKIVGDKFIGFSNKIGQEVEIETALIKPMLKGKDVKRFSKISHDFYVIYPHHEVEGKTIPYEEEEMKLKFPLTYNYMLPFKEALVKKKIHKKTNPKYWYSLHRSREKTVFEQEKIITPETSLGGNMSIDYSKFYHNTQVYSLIRNNEYELDYKFLIAVLNSNLFWFYLQSTGAILRGGYFRFKTKYLEPFPFPEPISHKEQIPFIEKVNIMLKNTTEIQNIQSQFLLLFQSKFELEKLSSNLQNWYKLDFKDFLKELKKAKVQLSLSEEAEWMHYFNEQKQLALQLKSEIDQTDKEIDRMVYTLYGLTEEEVKIIEKI